MSIAANWFIDFSSGIPVYKQIINTIYTAVSTGKLREGDRLPTIKELTLQLNVNPNTIAKAYRELDLKGVITSKRGNGSFISESPLEVPKLSAKQRKAKLEALFGRVIAEAQVEGIGESELLRHIQERIEGNESV
ncbi:MAG: GntR family transcriptional regulator [Phycisphaerae bacterium]|nr:GntR family transcriptional regulator [Phycisphaerae bacterium]